MGAPAKIILLALLCMVSNAHSEEDHDDSCVVEDIEVQKNFDAKKLLGRWYEIKWAVPHYMDPAFMYVDYTETISKLADGNFSVKVQGTDAKACDHENVYQLYKTDTPGKLSWSSKKVQNINYWVLEVNDNFLVVYACDIIDEDSGVCDKSSGNIWSRESTLSDDKLAEAYAAAAKACMKKDDFIDTPQDEECTEDGNGYEPFRQSSFVLIYSLAVCIESLWHA